MQDSCVLIPCTFSYPSTVTPTEGIVVIWYKEYEGQRTVIYHSATPSDVDGRFQGRTELLGDPAAHNCTLLLRGLKSEDSGKYNFRFEINQGDRWSDLRGVTLTVNGEYGDELARAGEIATAQLCVMGSVLLPAMGNFPVACVLLEQLTSIPTAAMNVQGYSAAMKK